jgi:hypothetical protein
MMARWPAFLATRSAAIAAAIALVACGAAPSAPQPSGPLSARRPSSPSTAIAPLDWGIPRFFEIGTAVPFGSTRRPIDTEGWLGALTAGRGTSEREHDDPPPRAFVYSEPEAEGGTLHRFALILPGSQPYATNGTVVAHWSDPPDAFDFGFEGVHTFGSVTAAGDPASRPRVLRARFSPSGVNAQDQEIVYDLEGTAFSLLEHRGLVPGTAASFDRFTLFDGARTRARAPESAEPVPLAPSPDTPAVTIGLRPPRDSSWKTVTALVLSAHRVLDA